MPSQRDAIQLGVRALSLKTRFRGPLVAQTSVRSLAQPCGAKPAAGRKAPANEHVQRRSVPGVVVPDSACHAGGRVRVPSLPLKYLQLAIFCRGSTAGLSRIPHRSRTRTSRESPLGADRSRQSPQEGRPARLAGGRLAADQEAASLRVFSSLRTTAPEGIPRGSRISLSFAQMALGSCRFFRPSTGSCHAHPPVQEGVDLGSSVSAQSTSQARF
jgi:hypothetical protein